MGSFGNNIGQVFGRYSNVKNARNIVMESVGDTAWRKDAEEEVDKVVALVRNGLKKGAIEISDKLSDYGVLGLGCIIGDNAFYFGTVDFDELEIETPEQYFAKRTHEEVIADISFTLLCFLFDFPEDPDEGLYLIACLSSHEDQVRNACDDINTYNCG